jgi:hypothetical protein
LKAPFRLAAIIATAAVWSACGPATGPGGADRSPLAQKWLDRAKTSYGAADADDAHDAITSALQAGPHDIEVRTWAGKVALARLEYAETIRLLKGLHTTEARGLRGRAYWYGGEIEAAADELEAMLKDPDVHDGWAKSIAALARRGAGRKPFQLSGGLLAVTEMPRVLGSTLIVPVEIDGEQALSVISTGSPEVILDSSTRKEPSWVSLRFGGKVEVRDVPATVQDLSGISRTMNAPIKALLGVNLLRHVNPTFDFIAGQFVVRSFAPPAPPVATKVPIAYLKGGGMVTRSGFGNEPNAAPASMLIDTSLNLAVALDEAGWKKAGVDPGKLQAMPEDPKLKQGIVPFVWLGTFRIPQIPGVLGVPIAEMEKAVEADLDGLVGSRLLAAFRVTMTDGGRTLWLEDNVLPQASTSQAEATPPPAALPAGPNISPPPAPSARTPAQKPPPSHAGSRRGGAK